MTRKRRSRLIGCGLTLLAGLLGLGAVAGGLYAHWRSVNHLPKDWSIEVVLPKEPDPNGFHRMAALLAELPDLDYESDPSRLGIEVDLFADQIRAAGPKLDEVRETFELPWSYPRYDSAEHRLALRVVSKLAGYFVGECRLAEAEGDHALALHRAMDAMEFAAHASHGASFTDRIAAIRGQTFGMMQAESLVPLLAREDIPVALRRVRELREMWPGMAATVTYTRVATLDELEREFRRSNRLPLGEHLSGWWKAQEYSYLGETRRKRVANYFKFQMTPKRQALESLDRFYQEWTAEYAKPPGERQMPSVPEDSYSQMYLPATIEFSQDGRLELYRTELALLEVALAVRLHALTHGVQPESLAEVEAKWLPATPQDEWDRAIVYRLVAGQPMIFSLGENGKDDDGHFARRVFGEPTPNRDFVFGKLYERQRRKAVAAPPPSAANSQQPNNQAADEAMDVMTEMFGLGREKTAWEIFKEWLE